MKNKSNGDNKGSNKIINWFKDNTKSLVFLCVGVVIGIGILACFWPKRIVKLNNGEEVILEVKDKKVTANELYQQLMETNGTEAVFKIVDNYLLRGKYNDLGEEAAAFVKEQSETIYSTYENYYGYTKEQFLTANGFKTEQAFLDYLDEEFYYEKYYNEYVADTIKENDIKDYYKKKVFGEKNVYLFAAESKDELEKVRSELKKNTSFNDIKSKYTNVSAFSFEALTFKDSQTVTDTVLEKVASTKKGKYTEVFSDNSYKNAVVYIVDEKDKPTIDDVRQDIVDILVKEKQQSDEKLYYQAFISLRKENNLTIYDTKLKDLYDQNVKQYK